LDQTDREILACLQDDATMPVAEIARRVGLSSTPCWRVGVTVFVFIRTNRHTQEWLERFATAVDQMPEVVEFHRMSGEVDYLLKVVVPDIAAYDEFYRKLISQIELYDVNSSFAMEQIKLTTALPLRYAE
jgi:Lrp/AsnC family transcriptional regulator